MEKLVAFNKSFNEVKNQVKNFYDLAIDGISESNSLYILHKDAESHIGIDPDDDTLYGVYKLFVSLENNKSFSIKADYSQPKALISVKINYESDFDDIYRDVSFICNRTKLESELRRFLAITFE